MKYSSINIKITKLMMYLITDGTKRAKYLKKHGVFKDMGEKCYYHTRDIPSEPYLVKIGNNVKIAANVRMITHDIISTMVNEIPEYSNDKKLPYYLGKIEIGDNVMIGANSTILYNVKVGSNSIVAAGSVVTKDVPEGMVVGGNPAKVICSLDDFVEKRRKLPDNPPKKSEGIYNLINYYWNEVK